MRKIIEKAKSKVEEGLKWEDSPRIKDDQFEGGKVVGRDRILLTISDASMDMGHGATMGVRISNANRGSSYFQINDEKDIKKLEDSFSKAMFGVRGALAAHKKAKKDFLRAKAASEGFPPVK